jgi:hypothetical protein
VQSDDSVLAQLDEVLQEFAALRKRSQHDGVSDLPESEVVRFVTRARAAIHRVAGKPSVYVDQCEEIMKHGGYPVTLRDNLPACLTLYELTLRTVIYVLKGSFYTASYLETFLRWPRTFSTSL